MTRRQGLVLVAAAASSWGLWSLFLRPTAVPATVATPLMFAVMGISMLPVALTAPPATWGRVSLLLLAGNVVADAVNVIAFFEAMTRTTVAVAVLTHYLAPIFVAVAAPWIDRQQVPGARVAAVVATAGLALVLEPWRGVDGVWVGAAFGALSAVAYAANVFVVARLVPRIGAARTVSYHALLGAALLAPLAWPHLGGISPGDVGLITAGSLTIGAVSGVAFCAGLAIIGSARAAVLTFCEPLVAVLVGWLVWHEPLGPLAILGAALIVGAGAHVARARG